MKAEIYTRFVSKNPIMVYPCRECGTKLSGCAVRVLYLGEHFCVFCDDMCLNAWKDHIANLGLSEPDDLRLEMSKQVVRFIVDRM